MTPDRIKELMDQLSEARAENERLRDDLFQTVAAFAESGAKNADSVREMIGAVNSIEKSLKEAQAERDALQARIDGALVVLQNIKMISEIPQTIKKAIEILTGEGENA